MLTTKPHTLRALAKLERRRALSVPAREAFLALPAKLQVFAAHTDIVREGDETTHCRFLESGVVSRSKLVPNGGRQIVAFHLAGDLIDLPAALLLVADHTIRTHAPSILASIHNLEILRLAEDYPEIGRAFWFDTLVDASIFREWSINLGRRSARERTAHLLLEIGYRSSEAQLSSRENFALPMTQIDLADALGLTVVHVNRSLRWLRESGFIKMQAKRIIILDWDELAHFAAFRPLYLHPEGPRAMHH